MFYLLTVTVTIKLLLLLALFTRVLFAQKCQSKAIHKSLYKPFNFGNRTDTVNPRIYFISCPYESAISLNHVLFFHQQLKKRFKARLVDVYVQKFQKFFISQETFSIQVRKAFYSVNYHKKSFPLIDFTIQRSRYG